MEHDTIQYRLDLPNVLYAISPTLAALHASRVAALHPETTTILAPSHCPKCGVYHFSGDHPTPLICGPSTRKKRKRDASSRPKSIQRRCHSCGFSIDTRTSPSLDHPSVPIPVPNALPKAGTVPAIQRTNETGRGAPPVDTPRRTTVTAPTIPRRVDPPAPPRQSKPQPKTSHTRNSALRDILSRDRQREDVGKRNKKNKQGHEGLAAFLKEL
ncbi:hypothetical protein JVU11DRAFT_1876 [Chiua virens]|nr:hypothetical protein JVU11DRAFT_1876 [Chiua virens]